MLNYIEAHKIAALGHPIRRPSWPADRHVRHHVEESVSKLKLHTPESPDALEWQPSDEDEAAQDWEQYIPQQRPEEPEEVEEGSEEEPDKTAKGRKKKS